MTFDAFVSDVHGGFKVLRKARGWTAVAVVSIALGIGANLLVFAIVDAVLLRPFPYRDPAKLVFLWGTKSDEVRRGISGPDMDDWRRQSRSFTDIDAFLGQMSYTVGDSGETVLGACVGPSVLPILGVTPALGRGFTPNDSVGAGQPVVIVGETFWRTRMGAVPSAIGSTLMLNGRAFEVVGVTPRGFFFPDTTSQILQAAPCGMTNFRERGTPVMHGIGRLRGSVTLAQAQADLDLINRRLAQAYPVADKDVTVGIQPLRNIVVGKYERALWLLLGAVGLVLLLACANVAHLQLARGVDRQVELAVRSALGATRGRLFAQLLTESLVVATAGAICALSAAWVGIRLLRSLSLTDIARIDTAHVDVRLMAVTALLALAVTVVSGVWPAWKHAGVSVNDTLKMGSAGATTAPRRTAREFLATTELALAMVLLVAAGLLVGSFVRLIRANWGFDPTNLDAISVTLPAEAAASQEAFGAVIEPIRARIAALPGVASVATGDGVPVKWGRWTPSRLLVDGKRVGAGGWTIGHGYFRALGTPVIEGREFTAQDDARAEPVTVVSEALARTLWPGQSALGHHFQILSLRLVNGKLAPDIAARIRRRDETLSSDPSAWEAGGISWKVVGVVNDIRAFGLDVNPEPAFYLDYRQEPRWTDNARQVIAVRVQPGAASIIGAVRAAITETDPRVSIRSVDAASELVAHSIGGRGSTRLMMLVSALFGTLTLLLTMTGIFGIVLHTVNQRLQEVGVRMALGADRGDVARLFALYAARISLGGIALGTAIAWAVSRLLRSVVFEITPTDPATYAISLALLVGCVLLACVIPIRRAMQFDPTALLQA